MNTFVCYDRCGTCKKAEAFLKEHNIPYEKRPIKEQNPSAEELRAWWQMSGLPLRKFFNTSGLLYKDLQLKDKTGCSSNALCWYRRERFWSVSDRRNGKRRFRDKVWFPTLHYRITPLS